MQKIRYLENFDNCETELEYIFVPYKGVLKLSKLRYMEFSKIWELLVNLVSFDIGEYKSDDMLANIVLGLDSLWEGMACIIRRDVEIEKARGMQEILLPVCKFNTTYGQRVIDNTNNISREDNVVLFNGRYHKLTQNESSSTSFLLGVPWSKLVVGNEGFYCPEEYRSFVLQQIALIVTSYMEKEPSQYLIMQTEAMKKSIYSNWDSIYKNYMPEFEKQDIQQFMQVPDNGRGQ